MANRLGVSEWQVTRARKYRVDPLVHRAIVDHTRNARPVKIVCTNYWVFGYQVNRTNKPVSCITCIGTRERTR